MAALREPVPASQLHQRALDRQRGLSGMPSFPWPPGLAPVVGRFAGSISTLTLGDRHVVSRVDGCVKMRRPDRPQP
jgi:hypothetical protein